MILGIDHVGLAVRDAAGAAAAFSRITARPATEVAHLPDQAVRVCFVPAGRPDGSPAAARLELLEPAGEDTPLARFLARRGEGLHHVCFAVDGIVEELTRLEALGLEPVDRTPRRGALGGLVVFLHPRTAHGVLIELLQRDPAATAPAGELPAPEPPAPAGP